MAEETKQTNNQTNKQTDKHTNKQGHRGLMFMGSCEVFTAHLLWQSFCDEIVSRAVGGNRMQTSISYPEGAMS